MENGLLSMLIGSLLIPLGKMCLDAHNELKRTNRALRRRCRDLENKLRKLNERPRKRKRRATAKESKGDIEPSS